MPVDPHIAATLAMLDEAGMPPLHEGRAEARRAQYVALTHGAPTPAHLVDRRSAGHRSTRCSTNQSRAAPEDTSKPAPV